MMSAALFGRRSKRGIDDPPASSDGAGTTGPNVFAPDGASTAPKPLPPPPPPPPAEQRSTGGDASASDEMPSHPPGTVSGGRTGEDDGLIGGSLLAELEARAQSNHPAPHPVRPQEMWHPGVTPQPVDLPAPPAEERIDQAELDGADTAPGRFRFNRLRRVTPGEATSAPSSTAGLGAPAADTEESVGDVLFGELFTSDRIPSGTEGLGSGAAPLVPRSDGPNSGLINGPVRRHPRSAGRALPVAPEPNAEADVVTDQQDSDDAEELPAPDPDPAATAAAAAIDHDADPVVETTDVEAQEPEARSLDVAADGSVELDAASLRLDPDADVTVTDDGTTSSLTLRDGWCWAALGKDARPLTVTADGLVLQCPAGTTSLVSIDATGHFVVAVRGEAVLEVGGRRIRLRTGAMAFISHGATEAQVDVATEDEIAADPLVAHNLGLDAER